MVFRSPWLLAAALTASALPASATPLQEALNAENVRGMSLEQLLDVRVNTASVTASRWIHQPATVTVFSREDLVALGARDLMEALEFVPGTDFGVDVFGVIGLGFRGMWAHEGKALLLIDDMPVVDLMYGNLNLGRHYPIEQIERVEVLRGAGGARYGDNAQLAVIRVTTREVSDGTTEFSAYVERIADAGNRSALTASGGTSGENWRAHGSLHASQGPWSGAMWRDTVGARNDLGDLSKIEALDFIGRLDVHDLRLRVFVDEHRNENPQFFGFGRDGEEVSFRSINVMAAYDKVVGDAWTLTPKLQWRRQDDWFIERDPELIPPPPLDFRLPARRLAGSFEAAADFDHADLLVGAEVWRENAEADSPGGVTDDPGVYFNGSRTVDHTGAAAFGQLDVRRGRFTVSAGLRFSDHSYAGSSTVPRLSTVYARDTWHAKAHYGRAFREPDIEVINASNFAGDPIVPEETEQIEFELGWRPRPQVFGTVSVYRLETEDPIIYGSNSDPGGYFYTNNDPVGTEGFETEWRWHRGSSRAFLTYSTYRALGTPIEQYLVTDDTSLHVGAAQHKLTLAGSRRAFDDRVCFQSAVVWYGTTWAYDYEPGADGIFGNELALRALDDRVAVNTRVRYVAPQWQLELGVHDVFDEGRLFAQPYRSESTPYPGPGRQVWLRLTAQPGP